MLSYNTGTHIPAMLELYNKLQLADCRLEIAVRAWTPRAIEAEAKAALKHAHACDKAVRAWRRMKRANEAEAIRKAKAEAKGRKVGPTPRLNKRLAKLAAARRAAKARAEKAAKEARMLDPRFNEIAAKIPAATDRLNAAKVAFDAYKAYATDGGDAATSLVLEAEVEGAKIALRLLEHERDELARRLAADVADIMAGRCPIRHALPCPNTEDDKESYRLAVLDFTAVFGEELTALIHKAAMIRHTPVAERERGWRTKLCGLLSAAEAVVSEMIKSGTGQSVTRATLPSTLMARCSATDEALSLGWSPSEAYISAKLGIVSAVEAFEIDSQYLSTVERCANLAQRLNYICLIHGVTVNGRVYKMVAATPSQQKVGDSYWAADEYMAKAEPRFWSLGQTLDNYRSNGSEELKRAALKFTPSTIARGENGETIRVDEVLMLPAIKQNIMHDEALEFTTAVKDYLRLVRNMPDEANRFDGAGWILVAGFGAGFQFRSGAALALKGLAVTVISVLDALIRDGHVLPETMSDINGKIWAFPWSTGETKSKYPVAKMITTTDTWKGKSLGFSWTEAVRRVTCLEKIWPEAALLRVVRYIDAATDGRRKLGRQMLQEFVNFGSVDRQAAGKLVNKAVKKQLRQRTLLRQLVKMGETMSSIDNRSDFALLILQHPELLTTPAFQAYLAAKDKGQMQWLASGRIPVNGSYPFITEDPYAAMQHILLGKSMDDADIGLLKADEVSVADYADGVELFTCRYPLNFIAGRLVTNLMTEAYESLGGIMVLPAHGDILIAMDGDVDGDEAFVTDNDLIRRLASAALKLSIMGSKRMPVLVFPHDDREATDRSSAKEAFVSLKDRNCQVATALYRVAKYNLVGIYANAAAAYMAQAAARYADNDDVGAHNALVAAAWCHVGSILVIDMAKTGYMPLFIRQKVAELVDSKPVMPWNQRFNHGLTDEEWEVLCNSEEPDIAPRPIKGYLPDAMASVVYSQLNDWSFDDNGVSGENAISDLLFDGVGSAQMQFVIDDKFFDRIATMNFNANQSAAEFIAKVTRGEKVGVTQILEFFWNNESALKYRMAVEEDTRDAVQRLAEQANMLCALVGRIIIHGAKAAYGEDGAKRVVNRYLADALTMSNGIAADEVDPEEQMRKKANYAVFVTRVFAHYLVHGVEELIDPGTDPAIEHMIDMDDLDLNIPDFDA